MANLISKNFPYAPCKHFSRHKYCHKCGALFEGRFLKRHISRCGVIKPEKLKKKFECFKCHKKFDY